VPKIDRREFLVVSGAAAGLAAAGAGAAPTAAARVRVRGLKVDYLDRPVGLGNTDPQLSWLLESSKRDVRQSAYRVLVASSEETLKSGRGDLWDSGKVRSSDSFGIRYGGEELHSRRRWWPVTVWDQAGVASDPTEASTWEMGLLNPTDWTAQWVAPRRSSEQAPLLRRSFVLRNAVRQARVYVTSLGLYQLFLNGERVGTPAAPHRVATA